MANYSQEKRTIRVETPLGKDKLLLIGISGHEAISSVYRYRLEMMSEDAGISGADLLRKSVSVAIVLADGKERWINGIVSRFAQLGQRDELTFYEAEIVPKFALLGMSQDCRIFQQKSVVDIVGEVLKEHDVPHSVKAGEASSRREYCVQYRESNLNFVQRLLEEEGLNYTFEHSRGRHQMVIGGPNQRHDIDGPQKIRFALQPDHDEDIINEIRREDAVYIGKVTLNNYDYTQPSLSLVASASGKGVEEVYDYPAKYSGTRDGERYALYRLEAEEALRQRLHGDGSCRGFTAGGVFTVTDHYRADMNRRYKVLEAKLKINAGDYRTWTDGEFDSRCEFVAIPDNTLFRPRATTPRPIVQGSQTAIVVGPPGEEIHVDKYGRVKVQFYWDRKGKKDAGSSCWVRVSSAWAGKAWGAIHIPRIGQEVIVDFLEGDPDLPIITGRVYNAEQMPPYELPKNQTQSGIKSRSSADGGTEDFNEIRMEDLKGKEVLYIHAQRDKQVVVEHDRTEEVGNDETITIGANRTETVKKDETIDIKGKRTEDVGGNETVKIGAKRAVEVGSSEQLKVGTSRKTKIGTTETHEVGTNLTIKAGVSITLKVGANSIKIDNSGITIKGLQVKVQGTAMAEVKAPITAVKGTAMLETKAPLNQVNGDGMLKMRGGITMIN